MVSAKWQRQVVETGSKCPTKYKVSCLTLCTPVTFRLAREPLTLDTVFLLFAVDPLVTLALSFPLLPVSLFCFPWHGWSASHFCLSLDDREWGWRWGMRKPEQGKEALPLSGHSLESQDHQSFHAIRRDCVFFSGS